MLFTVDRGLAGVRICGISQAVTQEIKHEHSNDDKYARDEQPAMMRDLDHLLSILEQYPPTHGRRLET
jgi:hypothetical protein